MSGSGEQVPSAVGPNLLHPVLLRARVKVALTAVASLVFAFCNGSYDLVVLVIVRIIDRNGRN